QTHIPLHSFPTRRSSDLKRRGISREDTRANIFRKYYLLDPSRVIFLTCIYCITYEGGQDSMSYRVKNDTFAPASPRKKLGHVIIDRKSTRLNSSHLVISY